MQFLTVCIFLLATCGLALAQAVPLPRAKPLSSGMGDPPRLVPMTPVLPLHDVEAWPSDCALRLAEIARFAPQPTLNGPGQCGAADLVRLDGIIMTNGAPVSGKILAATQTNFSPDGFRSSSPLSPARQTALRTAALRSCGEDES